MFPLVFKIARVGEVFRTGLQLLLEDPAKCIVIS